MVALAMESEIRQWGSWNHNAGSLDDIFSNLCNTVRCVSILLGLLSSFNSPSELIVIFLLYYGLNHQIIRV